MPKGRKVGVGDMADELMRAMREYADLCSNDVRETAKRVAKDAVKGLKQTSPEGDGSKKGHYKDGWSYSVGKDSGYSIEITVYNRKKPSLTHLLEKGHAKRGGGRVNAIPHIEPVENRLIKDYEKRLKERLQA